jgi:hypothetical protein
VEKTRPPRILRERPDLDQLRRQAKELLAAFVAGEAEAVAEVNAHYRNADAAAFALHDAQLVLARERSWMNVTICCGARPWGGLVGGDARSW